MHARRTAAAAAVVLAVLLTTGCSQLPISWPLGPVTSRNTFSSIPMLYRGSSFSVPFALAEPAWLVPDAAVAQPNFVTWETRRGDRKLRIMVPVSVWRPGGYHDSPLPKDFVGFLLAQTKQGARFSDRVDTTVGGYPAMVITATTTTAADGSLGCPQRGLSGEDCYGLQPDLRVRIAVIDMAGKPLLVWLREAVGVRSRQRIVPALDAVLAGLTFTEARRPERPHPPRPYAGA